jgi:DNA invertase Pin-like site-specific DNA recombinase
MRKCAIYARYSSDLQSPKSIDDQLALCRAFAEREGWAIVATFEDRALSGASSENRAGYQALLREASAPKSAFQVILIEDLSRLTRDLGDLLQAERRLRVRGIEIVGVSDGIRTGQKGAKLGLLVKGLMNEIYLEDLREKTHRGMTGSFRRGCNPGGRVFGYRSVPIRADPSRPHDRTEGARLEVDPDEAEVVRRIFRYYSSGSSLRTIAHRLNEERVPFPAKGTAREEIRKGWGITTVRWVLRNQRYLGKVVWNRKQFVKDERGKRRSIERPESEWMVAESPELRIVSDELWNDVQTRIRMIEERYERVGRKGFRHARGLYSPYLLNGLLRCGHCSGGMEVISTRRRDRQTGTRLYSQRWYFCSAARNKGPAICKHTTRYRADLIESSVIDEFSAAMTPESVDRILAHVNNMLDRASSEEGRAPRKLAADLARLQKEADNLVEFIAAGDHRHESPRLREKLDAIEHRIAATEAEIVAAADRRAAGPVRVHRERLLAELEHLRELLSEDPARAKVEIARHLDGPLELRSLPSPAGERDDWEISGAVKAKGFLGREEPLLQVAGHPLGRFSSLRGSALPCCLPTSFPFEIEICEKIPPRRRGYR